MSFRETFITGHSDIDDTAAAGGSENTPCHVTENREKSGDSNPGSCTVENTSSTRRAITEAIEAMERQTCELREINRRLVMESNQLRRDNEELRQQLEQTCRQRSTAECRSAKLERDVARLEAELIDRRNEAEVAHSKTRELERRLGDIVTRFDELRLELDRKEVDFKTAVEKKNLELRRISSERESLRVRLQQLMASSPSTGVDIETMHEIESLKRDRNEIAAERDILAQKNGKLAVEVQNLANVLADRDNELRNERMRHGLLTRQFNSLLSENMILKERHQVKSVSTNGPASSRNGGSLKSRQVPVNSTTNSDSTATETGYRHRVGGSMANLQIACEKGDCASNETSRDLRLKRVTSSTSSSSVGVAKSRSSSCDGQSSRELQDSCSPQITSRVSQKQKAFGDNQSVDLNIAAPSSSRDVESMVQQRDLTTGANKDVNNNQKKKGNASQPMTSREKRFLTRHSSLRDSSSRASNISLSRIQMTPSQTSPSGFTASVSGPVAARIPSADISQRHLPSVRSVSSSESGHQKKWMP